MNLQISIFGLLIATVLYVACGSALFAVWRRVRGETWAKIVLPALAITVLLVPWVDEVWIAWNFKELCKGAGVRVVRKVETDGYYDSTTSGWDKPTVLTDPKLISDLERSGFRFSERNAGFASDRLGKISHLEKHADGLWRISILDRPEARYHYKRIVDYRDATGIHEEISVAYKIMMTGEEVIDTKSGEIIGRNIEYSRRPGWLEGSWLRFVGTGATICRGSAPEAGGLRYLLHHYVLIPVAKR